MSMHLSMPVSDSFLCTESYVAELMKNKTSGQVPKIAKYRSADIAAPYVLVCNYSDTNSKIVCTPGVIVNHAIAIVSDDLYSYIRP